MGSWYIAGRLKHPGALRDYVCTQVILGIGRQMRPSKTFYLCMTTARALNIAENKFLLVLGNFCCQYLEFLDFEIAATRKF